MPLDSPPQQIDMTSPTFENKSVLRSCFTPMKCVCFSFCQHGLYGHHRGCRRRLVVCPHRSGRRAGVTQVSRVCVCVTIGYRHATVTSAGAVDDTSHRYEFIRCVLFVACIFKSARICDK